MSILIVDDSPDELQLLSSLLERAGYRSLLTATSADDAFRTLGVAGSESSPAPVDLVLMDIMMPHTDGLEACQRIRAHHQLHDLPIIVITVKSDPGDLRDAFTAGATDFIRKPVNEVELVARVSAALTLREERECRKEREQQLIRRTEELERALHEVKVLRGLIPICSHCKGVRNEQGFWQHIEEYLRDHSELEFTHGVCETCLAQPASRSHRPSTNRNATDSSPAVAITGIDKRGQSGTRGVELSSTETAEDGVQARKARRVTFHCRLLFSAEHIPSGEARVLDLSTSGCKAESLTAVKKGMELTVKFFLPDHQWELKIERAAVRWVEGKTFGLEFLSIRPAQRERLRLLLARSEND